MPFDFKTEKYIPGLDAVRAFSILLVTLGHFGLSKMIPGGFGVTVFFFISGFLITKLLFQEFLKRGEISIKQFYFRRFMRLMPELFALIAITYVYQTLLGNPPTMLEIVSAIGYFTNYTLAANTYFNLGIDPAWGHLWSLSVEEHFYILFPLIFLPLVKSKDLRISFFVALLIGCLAWRIALVHFDFNFANPALPYTYSASEARFDSIAYGVLFAMIAQSPWRLSAGKQLVCLLLGSLILIATLAVRDDTFRETFRYSLQGIGLGLVFAYLYLGTSRPAVINLMELPLLKLLGVLSYGAYLWHLQYLYLAERLFHITRDTLHGFQGLLFTGGGILFTFTVSYVSYVLIHVQAKKLQKSILETRSKTTALAHTGNSD